MSFFGFVRGYRGCMAVFMVYYEFKLYISFDGGCRGYMAIVTMVLL